MKVADVRERLREAGVRPSKALGQHFLLREALAERMAAYAEIQREETVLEVGPGLGVLTEALLRRTDRVLAIEKDGRLCDALRRRHPSLRLVHGDVLREEVPPFDCVVSNLPYEISSPFTFWLLERPFRRAVLTFQREFAERMAAGRGQPAYGRLSVKASYRAGIRLRDAVPRQAFWPPPKVDSAVVQLDPRPPPFAVPEEAFHRVVDALFTHRRKTALNALLASWEAVAPSPDALRARLAETPLASRRAEEMTPEEMGDLTNLLLPKG